MAWFNTALTKGESMNVWVGNSSNPGYQWSGWSVTGTVYNASTWSSIPAFLLDFAVWEKLRNDGTTMYEYYSNDGMSWTLAYSHALSGSYLGTSGYNDICLEETADENAQNGIYLLNY